MSAGYDRISTSIADSFTESLVFRLANPTRSPEFDLHACLDEVLSDVGMSSSDSGGKVSFYGQDPILPSRLRFGAMSAVGLAAKVLAVAAIWKDRTGEAQDIEVDIRKPDLRGVLMGLGQLAACEAPLSATEQLEERVRQLEKERDSLQKVVCCLLTKNERLRQQLQGEREVMDKPTHQ